MCDDLKTRTTPFIRARLSRAIDDWEKTQDDSDAERFAVGLLAAVSAALNERLSQPKATLGKLYIAGPMRGIPEFNFPAFKAAATRLRAEGWEVFSPAESDNDHHGADISVGNTEGSEEVASAQHGFSLREALARDMRYIAETATAIYMLRGWEKSTGAKAEHALAVALGADKVRIIYEGDE